MKDLTFPANSFQLVGLTELDSVPIGMKAHLSCNPGQMLNSTLDPELDGLDVRNVLPIFNILIFFTKI